MEAGARWSEVSRLIYVFLVWVTGWLVFVLVEIVSIGRTCRFGKKS